MSSLSRSAKRKWTFSIAGILVVLGGFAYWYFGDCDICYAAQTGTLTARGTLPPTCNIVVNQTAGALTLNLETGGAVRQQAGTVTATCNKKAGFTLSVASANCSSIPVNGVGVPESPTAGAKMLDTLVPVADSDWIQFSIEFANVGGATWTVDQASRTLLLNANCPGAPGALGNTVTGKVTGDQLVSTLFVNFTGAAAGTLSAGTYEDVVTVTMTVP